MKTDAIKQGIDLISRKLAKTVMDPEADRYALPNKMEAELLALEADNARKAGEIEEWRGLIGRILRESLSRADVISAVHAIDANAITGAPSGAFVTLEQLKAIEWQGPRIQTEAFDCVYCPACKGRIGHHESDCWLSAKLKEVGDES